MDDSIFFNAGTLSTSDIQNFLNSKVPSCDTNHAGSGSNQPPFTCLKDYSQSVTARAADAYCPNALGGGTKSSAQIIRDVATACSINPEVLIVLLQKEQALVTDTWPWASQYNYATGYACSDSAPCDPDFAGFSNQLWWAARQFQRYVKQAGSFNYAVGRNSFVAYQANNAGCGGTNITMQTSATAALYNYTPYQPNAAALNNLYGTGDSCSAYGNRNFWRLFNDWFGPTTNDSDADVINFIRLNHSSGNVESVGYTSISGYSYPARYSLTSYPSVPPDGCVIPLTRPNGDLSLIRLNYISGNVEEVSYTKESGYKQISSHEITGYPDVACDGSVVPLYRPNGDLSFIRLNHVSGHVEEVSYTGQSGYRQMSSYELTNYPSVPPNSGVIPLYRPNGDLTFIRLNHVSGNVEEVSYTGQSGYRQMSSYELTGYPSVAPDGAVIPLYRPNGDLMFIRLNHSSGNVEEVSYSGQSGYRQITSYALTGYPSVAPNTGVIPLITR